MLQYLVIVLDAASTSYCHYSNPVAEPGLISLDDLRKGIFFAMKENLMIQFVYPSHELPEVYLEAIHTIDHSNIVPANCADKELLAQADVVVLNSWAETMGMAWNKETCYVLRTAKDELFARYEQLAGILKQVKRLNIVITDVECFKDTDYDAYREVLAVLSAEIEQMYVDGLAPQLNLLTDRMMLERMNNCNAGCENITLAPDGRFYVCPAFYHALQADGTEKSQSEVCVKGYSIGSLTDGLDVKNAPLYQIDHAPLCRQCDAYHCRRCVWLNRKTTCEVNTPSHEQCVVAHLERNAARTLLANIRKHGTFLPHLPEIKEITYLDPFEVKEQW